MEKIVFVSGNSGKLERMKRKFADAFIPIDTFICDLEEPNVQDIIFISKRKAVDAFDHVKCPCFVADSGFYIEDYPANPGYPGAFAKRSGVSNNTGDLLKQMEGISNRNCKFLDCLTFYDGVHFSSFFGESKGTLAYEERGILSAEGKSKLHFLFIPEGSTKTLAEMTVEEIDQDGHLSATDQFITWYQKNYVGSSKGEKVCKKIQ